MSQLSQICPVTDAEAERIVHPATFADLASRITASPAATADGARARPSPATSSRARRRWLIGAPLAAGLAVAVLLVTWLASPAQRVGPASPAQRVGPARIVHHVRPVHHRHRPQPAGRPGPLPGRIRRAPPGHHAHARPRLTLTGRHARLFRSVRERRNHADHRAGQVLHRRRRQRVPGRGADPG
jgi:hypothetical protein